MNVSVTYYDSESLPPMPEGRVKYKVSDDGKWKECSEKDFRKFMNKNKLDDIPKAKNRPGKFM